MIPPPDWARQVFGDHQCGGTEVGYQVLLLAFHSFLVLQSGTAVWGGRCSGPCTAVSDWKRRYICAGFKWQECGRAGNGIYIVLSAALSSADTVLYHGDPNGAGMGALNRTASSHRRYPRGKGRDGG